MSIRRLLLVLSAAAVACHHGGPPPLMAARPAISPMFPRFEPRLVRPYRWHHGHRTEASGVLRLVTTDSRRVRVLDPDSGVVFADEVVHDVSDARIDPSFRVVCLEIREFREGAPTELGAYDLGARRWLWRQEWAHEGHHRDVRVVLATPESCVFMISAPVPGGPYQVERRGLVDGSQQDGRTVPLFDLAGESRTARWSDDRSTVALTQPAPSTTGQPGRVVELRDTRTLARLGGWWEPAPPEKEPPPEPRPFLLPAPWSRLSDTTVAHHDEQGLFLWDHGHQRMPVRIEGAPPLTRIPHYSFSRPHHLVVPTDASWVGVVRSNGRLARFSTADRSPLADVPLPGPPGDPGETKWQVFAGSRERLLAIRTLAGRRAAFVGDTGGVWTRARARIFAHCWQNAQYLEHERSWLVGDPFYGLERLDEVTGQLAASFMLPKATITRVSRPARSPDGRELVVTIDDWPDDPIHGLYFLDASSLRVVRHFPYVPPAPFWFDLDAWEAEGVIESVMDGPRWYAIDPRTGKRRPLWKGDQRSLEQYAWGNGPQLSLASDRGALVARHRGAPEDWIAIVDGGAVIEHPDGHVWCAGAGCQVHRCVAGMRDARPATDPACAHLLVHAR